MAQDTTKFQDLSDDIMNVCRACMSRKENTQSVFSDKKPRTYEMFEYCTGIRITRSDIFPKKICNSCLSKLYIAYKFKKDCVQTEKTLHEEFEKCGLKEEIKKENVFAELEIDINCKEDVTDIKIKEDAIKEEILINKEENDDTYEDDDVTICISDDDDSDLDYKPDEMKRNSPKLGAKENKNAKQLIANVPTGVSVKLININENHISDKKINKNIKSVKKVKSKYVKKTPGEKLYRRLYCNKCNVQFLTSQEIEEHKRDFHTFEPTICEICGEVPHNRDAQYTHMKTHQEPTHKCEFCDYATVYPKDLDKHLRIHKGVKEYVCEYCTRAFHTLSNLKFHTRSRHGSVDLKYNCPRCSYKTYCKSKLKRHMDGHDNIKRFECELCDSRFARREFWKKHVETTHNISVPRLRPGKQRNGLKFTNIESVLKYTGDKFAK